MWKKYILGLAFMLSVGMIATPNAFGGDANLDGTVDSGDLKSRSSTGQKEKSKKKIPSSAKIGNITLKRGIISGKEKKLGLKADKYDQMAKQGKRTKVNIETEILSMNLKGSGGATAAGGDHSHEGWIDILAWNHSVKKKFLKKFKGAKLKAVRKRAFAECYNQKTSGLKSRAKPSKPATGKPNEFYDYPGIYRAKAKAGEECEKQWM